MSTTPSISQAQEDGRELVRAVLRVETAVRELPSRQYIGWENDDTAEFEQRLDDREADRQRGKFAKPRANPPP